MVDSTNKVVSQGTLSELIAPDAVQHMPGNNMFSGDHRGLQDILGMYGKLAEETGGTFQVDLEEVYANDDTVVTVYRATGDRGGQHLDSRHALVFTMRNEQVIDLMTSRRTPRPTTSSGPEPESLRPIEDHDHRGQHQRLGRAVGPGVDQRQTRAAGASPD